MPNFWDHSWNVFGGCRPVSPGCKNCYASQLAATQQVAHQIPLYRGVTSWVREKPVFNGRTTVLEPEHPAWVFPLRWPGAGRPIMGVGMPSLIFVADMSDAFLEDRPAALIRRAVETIGMSKHIGQLLTKRPARMVEFFTDERLSPKTIEHWQRKLWLGFSAERQLEFDQRWSHMRELAARGWLVFACLGPMIAPIVLPADFVALDRGWVIASGEVCPGARPMRPDWARSIRDQCADAGVPYFTLQMSRKAPIPLDLQIWQFPRCDGGTP